MLTLSCFLIAFNSSFKKLFFLLWLLFGFLEMLSFVFLVPIKVDYLTIIMLFYQGSNIVYRLNLQTELYWLLSFSFLYFLPEIFSESFFLFRFFIYFWYSAGISFETHSFCIFSYSFVFFINWFVFKFFKIFFWIYGNCTNVWISIFSTS